jgi:molybdopterin-guanine dinucleotide biosynthesis protein A
MRVGVILAGGEGSRIGGNKAAVMLGARPLIRWVMDALHPQVDALAISGASPDLAEYGQPVLADDASTNGPAAGVLAAIAHANSLNATSLLIAPCDMPFLPRDAQRALSVPGVGVPCVARRPIWAVSCWSHRALQDFQRPSQGLMAGPKGLSLRLILDSRHLQLIDAADPQAYFGVNTAQALHRAEAIAAQQAHGDAAS